MRALGVDLGTVRIGLALTDPSRTIDAPDWPQRVAAAIAEIAADVGADTIVVGLPRAMSGAETTGASSARTVADALQARTDAAVHLWDERLSSVEAERMLIGAGQRRAQRRTARDRVAAAIILQSWLQANPLP
jgi:putative Holliday junction resolvase